MNCVWSWTGTHVLLFPASSGSCDAKLEVTCVAMVLSPLMGICKCSVHHLFNVLSFRSVDATAMWVSPPACRCCKANALYRPCACCAFTQHPFSPAVKAAAGSSMGLASALDLVTASANASALARVLEGSSCPVLEVVARVGEASDWHASSALGYTRVSTVVCVCICGIGTSMDTGSAISATCCWRHMCPCTC